jgi:hypothetical protein
MQATVKSPSGVTAIHSIKPISVLPPQAITWLILGVFRLNTGARDRPLIATDAAADNPAAQGNTLHLPAGRIGRIGLAAVSRADVHRLSLNAGNFQGSFRHRAGLVGQERFVMTLRILIQVSEIPAAHINNYSRLSEARTILKRSNPPVKITQSVLPSADIHLVGMFTNSISRLAPVPFKSSQLS